MSVSIDNGRNYAASFTVSGGDSLSPRVSQGVCIHIEDPWKDRAPEIALVPEEDDF